MTATFLTLSQVFEALAAMERRALRAGYFPYAISMHPDQYAAFCTEVMFNLNVTVLPQAMRSTGPGVLGICNRMPCLPMAAPGVALHFK